MKRGVYVVLFVLISIYANAQMNYYGVTSEGGTHNAGLVFKTDSTGANLQTVHNFEYLNPGGNPVGKLCADAQGNLYGMTRWGGPHLSTYSYGGLKGAGYLFKLVYNSSGTSAEMQILHTFDITNGKWPTRGLLYHNGILYGTTREGGSGNKGVLFAYTISSGTYTVLHHFQYSSSTNDGEYPTGYLILASNGKIYGTTEEGGANQYYGTIFSYTPSNGTYTVEASFASGSGGNSPYGIVEGSDGNIYGINNQGATNNKGNIFRYNPTSHVLTARKDFNGKGAWGHIPMVKVGTDSLFGIISSGSWSPYYYNVFLYRPSLDSIAVLDTFMASNVHGFIYRSSDHSIYGGYYSGNVSGYFKYDINSASVSRVVYDTTNSIGRNYLAPYFDNNKIIGFAASGGYNNNGTLISYQLGSGGLSKQMSFKNPVNGVNPKGGLFLASNGKLYGLTYSGGVNDKGSVYKIDPANNDTVIKIADLSNSLGAYPEGGIMEASDGKLYFLTTAGGQNNAGTLIQLDPATNTLINKLNLGSTYGLKAACTPVEANGKLYFTSLQGTSGNYGAIVEYNLNTGSASAKYNFSSSSNVGFSVRGDLLKAKDGYLYFITGDDFSNYYSHGSISRFDPATGNVSFRKGLFSYSGYYSYANSFVEDENGILWTTITGGGNNSEGTLISYNPVTNSISTKVHMTQTNGNKPKGKLLYASNGNFYGMTSLGGLNYYGVMFEYNPATSTYSRKFSFNKTNGAYPLYGAMAEVSGQAIQIDSQITANSLCAGDTTFLRIIASHNSRLHYQWYRNDTLLPGETNDTLIIGSLTTSLNNTHYKCVVSGSAASVTSGTYTLIVHSPSSLSIVASDTNMCLGDPTITITASPSGGTLSGTGLINGNQFAPNTVGTSDIVYSYTNNWGCESKDTLSLTVYALPDASFSGLASTYCNNNLPDTLIPLNSGGSFSSYTVTGNVFYPGNVLFPLGVDSSQVQIIYNITDANMCSNSDTATSMVYKAPVVSFGGLASAFCKNDVPVLLTNGSPAGGTYWGDGIQGNTFTPSVAVTGNDTLVYTYTDNHNCSNSDTAFTIIYGLPAVSFGNLDTSFCTNDIPLILNNGTPNGGTYSGRGVQGIIFTAADAGLGRDTLVYTFTDIHNCTNRDTAFTTVYPAPQPQLPQDTQICINHSIILSPALGAGYQYQWSNGTTDSVLQINASNLGTGTHDFTLLVTHTISGCSERDTVVVIIDACTGLTEFIDKDLLSVFPNPSNGIIHVQSAQMIDQIFIYSSSGKIVWQEENIGKKEVRLDLSTMPKGVYFMSGTSGTKRFHKKLLIR
jgi:uncharacterized repeat protein (TIGR03803 family)